MAGAEENAKAEFKSLTPLFLRISLTFNPFKQTTLKLTG
jgi:hypothetical protein